MRGKSFGKEHWENTLNWQKKEFRKRALNCLEEEWLQREDWFLSAPARDEKFRAVDKNTGKTLWEYQLPVGGYATPATYEIEGRQFIVIGAGGGGFQKTKTGDYYFAFALPE